MKRQTLWTYDFTVITIGSFISLVGNALSNFALSLLVLDCTDSTFLYMLFQVSFQLPVMICPVLAGPYLDRVSRKKVIYALDFLSAGIYFLLFLLLRGGWFSYPALFAVSLLTGAIDGVYVVAFDSFYPNLISEGNFQKGYSVYGLLIDLSGLASPLAAVAYYGTGGAAQYKLHIPKEKKFSVAFFVYVTINVLSGTLLFLPAPLMAVWFFLDGALGVTSYTIRSAAMQSYIPDNKRARFNGIFQMICFIGSVTGSLAVGALAEALPERLIVAGANALVLGAVYLFIWRGREHVKKIYNRDV